MPTKAIPTIGDPNWGIPLNNHLSQLQNPSNGGINKFEQFSQRPTNLTADDAGKTYLYTQTGNIHQWTGTSWKVLNESVINVKDYGAVGDGVTDDSDIILQIVDNFNLNGSGKTLLFPKGVYKYDKYFPAGIANIDVETPAIGNIRFKNMNNFKVSGYGAVINFKGDFSRTGTPNKQGYTFGLTFNNCKNYVVEGFELNGNCDKMTRSNVTDEFGGTGISFADGNENFTLQDMYIHHFGMDGITQWGGVVCDKNMLMKNVSLKYNGRQGISIVELQNGTFINCEFSETGQSTYGGFAPGAGVDVESEFYFDAYRKEIDGTVFGTLLNPVKSTDRINGSLAFIDCKFENNFALSFVGGYTYSNISFTGCIFKDKPGVPTSFIPTATNTLVNNCDFDVDLAYTQATYDWRASLIVAHTTFTSCTIRSSGMCFYLTDNPHFYLKVEDCVLICTKKTIGTAGYYFPTLQAYSNATMKSNYIIIPATLYNGASYHEICLWGCKYSENNTFEIQGVLDTEKHFAVLYYNSAVNRDVFLQRVKNPPMVSSGARSFVSDTVVGTKYFRPSAGNTRTDVTKPYSQNLI
jgi:Pectate lyase superfamily protein